MTPDCSVCERHARPDSDAPDRVFKDDLFHVGHALPGDLTDVYLGWMVIEPTRHVVGLENLTDDEAAAFGTLSRDLSLAVKQTESADHIYLFRLGHVEPHLHVHVIPRYEGAPEEYSGQRVTEWPAAPRGGLDEIGALCRRVGEVLSTVADERLAI